MITKSFNCYFGEATTKPINLHGRQTKLLKPTWGISKPYLAENSGTATGYCIQPRLNPQDFAAWEGPACPNTQRLWMMPY